MWQTVRLPQKFESHHVAKRDKDTVPAESIVFKLQGQLCLTCFSLGYVRFSSTKVMFSLTSFRYDESASKQMNASPTDMLVSVGTKSIICELLHKVPVNTNHLLLQVISERTADSKGRVSCCSRQSSTITQHHTSGEYPMKICPSGIKSQRNLAGGRR